MLLIFSVQWVLASDINLPVLKYDQREPGRLPGSPVLRNIYRGVVSDDSDVKRIVLEDASLPKGEIDLFTIGNSKYPRGVFGGLPASQALDVGYNHGGYRAARDYSLITRERLEAKSPSGE